MERIYLKLQGPVFETGQPLDLVVGGLSGLQDLLDNTYKVLAGRQRITHKDREKYRIISREFQHGSFIAYLDIVMASVQVAMPFVAAVGPREIWEHSKNTYAFLKAVFSATKNSISPKYQVNDDGNMTVILGDQNIHYHGPVLEIGKISIDTYRKLDSLIEQGQMESLEIGHEDQPEITLDLQNKGIFENVLNIEQEPRILIGEIYDFNKYDHAGKIRIFENEHIPADTYKFKYIGAQSSEELILLMAEEMVTINCLIERINSPLDERLLGSLLITSIRREVA